MNDCPRAETTLAWAYGEAEEGHAAHIARCSACQQTLATLDLLHDTAMPAPAAPGVAPRRRFAPLAMTVVALAASLWLVLRPSTAPSPDLPPDTVADLLAPTAVDVGLDVLDEDVLTLTLDLTTL